jgi:TPR repeat protein
MKKSAIIIGGIALVVLISIAAVLVRNVQIDDAAAALKTSDYTTAFRKLHPLARVGDSHAQYLLGQMYAFGWGVPRNDDTAIAWFRRAAMSSEGLTDPAAAAEFYVAKNYREGHGVQKDDAQADKWLRRAVEGGYRVPAKGS